MGTVLQIFIRDLKRIARNPAAIVIALGVCIIPSLYAWINILANWNPYENTGTVPVEVVIEDEGATVPGLGAINAGEMIRERLEDNHQLEWVFSPNKDDAVSEVEAGSAYAAIVIPRDFSATLAGVVDGKPETADIAYYVNEKANAIAPKVTDTGATTLEAQIEGEFMRVVGDTVEFSTLGYVPRQLVIPDTIRHDAYSIVMPLEQDTIMLMETVIYPWPTREKFREAFLSLELPETEADIIRKNFNLATIREQAKHGKMDADMNYRSLLQEQVSHMYYQNQVVPNNLLNPFAWAQFIKQWRRRKEADKMIQQQTEGYQQYGNGDDSYYEEDYLDEE